MTIQKPSIIVMFSIFVVGVFLAPNLVVLEAQYGYYPPVCAPEATQRCVGNSIFWFDSCGRQQTWVKNCFGGCLDGKCLDYIPPYVKYYKKACSNNNLYWYDSKGNINDLYKSCSDSNECTQDTCSGSQCSNQLKCDGSTCQKGSSDYCSVCNYKGDGVCNCGETALNSPEDCKEQVAPITAKLDTSAFCGVMDGSINLSKNVTIGPEQSFNCLLVVKNISDNPIDDVTVRADLPLEIVSTEELKIDGMAFGGNITSGISMGSLSPNISKIITFKGKTQSSIGQSMSKQITWIANSGSVSSSDSLAINFQPAVSAAPSNVASIGSPLFIKFLERWYIWILIAVVLVFLFFVIFRRVSSNV